MEAKAAPHSLPSSSHDEGQAEWIPPMCRPKRLSLAAPRELGVSFVGRQRSLFDENTKKRKVKTPQAPNNPIKMTIVLSLPHVARALYHPDPRFYRCINNFTQFHRFIVFHIPKQTSRCRYFHHLFTLLLRRMQGRPRRPFRPKDSEGLGSQLHQLVGSTSCEDLLGSTGCEGGGHPKYQPNSLKRAKEAKNRARI